MNLQFVAIREDGHSELLPLRGGTLRVFLVLQDPLDPATHPNRPAPRTPWVTIRHSRAFTRGLPG